MAWRRIRRWGVLSAAAAGFVLLFSSVAAASPANDAFSSAQDLGEALPLSVDGSNVGATAEVDEPAHGGVPAAQSVWYRWHASADGLVKANVCESTSETSSAPPHLRLAVYTGDALSELATVADNGNGSSSCTVTFEAKAEVSYSLAVDDGVRSGFFTLRVHAVENAPNDDLKNAQVIPADFSGVTPGSTVGATAESGEPDHGGAPATRSIWYRWSPAEDMTVIGDVCWSEVDVRLAVYITPGLAPVADNGSFGDCRIAWRAEAGKTYLIALDSGGLEGDTALRLIPTTGVGNDDFSDAESIGPGDTGGFTLDGATAENGEPRHGGKPATKSVWLEWTSTFDGVATISACGGDPPRMAVYRGTQLQALTPVADNGKSGDCQVGFLVKSGVRYDIALDTFGDDDQATSAWEFVAYRHPPNDAFAAAQTLSIDPAIGGSVLGTTFGATAQLGEPDHFPGVDATYSVWYRWTAPRTEGVTFDTCSETFAVDSLLAVYSGASVSSLSQLGSNDDGPTCNLADSGFGNPFGSQVTINAVAGQQYSVAVDSYDMSAFELRISHSGPPTVVPQQPVTATGKRKAALQKCKKKLTKKARKKCRKRALKLPA
jgi:hypothetical protein